MNTRSLALFLAAAAIATAASAADLPPVLAPPARVEVPSGGAEVPLFRAHRLAVIEARVDGKGPFRFVVDWGANVFAVSPRLSRTAGLAETGRDGRGNPTSRVGTLEIGGARFSGLTAAVDPFFDGEGEDGVLGLNVFRDVVNVIDYPAGRFRIEEGALPAADGKSTFAYEADGEEQMTIPIEVAGRPFRAVLDTGASQGLLLPEALEGKFRYASPLTASPTPARGPQTRAYGRKEGVLEGALAIGSRRFPNPPVMTDPSRLFLVGGPILEKFEIALDQRNRRVRLREGGEPGFALAASPPALPPRESAASPIAARAAAYFDAFNSGDEERVRRFFEENFSSEALRERPASVRVDVYRRMRKVNGHFRVDRVLESTPERVVFLVENDAKEWRKIDFDADPKEKGKLLGFGVDDAEPPSTKPPEPPKATDAEAALAADRLLTEAAEKGDFSGVALLARGGVPFFRKAWGLADRERKIPNTVATKFNLGSINKIFTQVAIAQLAGAGKLSLADTIRKRLPSYRAPYADRVTIGQLVSMTSGMGDFFGPKFDATPKTRLRSLRDYLPLFEEDPLQFEPGKGRAYSNAGYVVLGLIVEAVSGEDYYRYVREHVFAPAGMTDTDSWATDDAVPNRAISYTREGGGGPHPSSEAHPARGSSAGGGYSTAEDLLRFDVALRNGRLAPPEWTAWILERTDAPKPGSGLPTHGGLGIAGGSPGVNAALDMEIGGGATIVVLANADPPAAERAARAIRGFLPSR